MNVYKSEEGKDRLRKSYDALLKCWGIPIEEQDHATQFGGTHVICAGAKENPPLLMFHGVGDDSAMMWIYNAGALSRRFRLMAIDTIGGPGKSVPNGKYYSAFDAKQWIIEILASLNIERTNILGVSYGCHLVQMLLAELPDKVDRAVGIAGLPVLEGFRESKWRGILRFLPEALFPTDRNCLRLLKKISGSNVGVFTENQVLWEHWKMILRDFNQQSMMRQNIKPVDPRLLLQAKDKALFIVGECDLHDPSRAARVRDAGYRLMVLPDTGHGVNHEQADVVNRAVIDFMVSA